MQPNCALALILASGLVGMQACNNWSQLALAMPFQSAETQPASPSNLFSPGQMPTADTWSQFIDSVRQIALAHANALPDFVCTQNVKRVAKLGEIGDWRLVDQIVIEVSYYQNRERYRILTIDNKPPSTKVAVETPGFSSEGDFGNALYLLFAPESNASFLMEGQDRVNKRKTVRARFHVFQSNSRYRIGLGDQIVTTAYGGRCWIDLASRQVVRLEAEAKDIPRSIPVKKSSHTTEYDLVEISGNKYWLPVHSSVHMQLVNGPHQQVDFYKAIYGKMDPSGHSGYPSVDAKNDMEYTHYRKFGTEIRLVTDQK
jgi:hypothetical protein